MGGPKVQKQDLEYIEHGANEHTSTNPLRDRLGCLSSTRKIGQNREPE